MDSNFIKNENIYMAKKDKENFERIYHDGLEDRLDIQNIQLHHDKSRRKKLFLTKNDPGHRNRLARDRLRLKLIDQRNNL